ncbi:MAG: fumarate reductase [Betaproteobacteria bacterium RIFCSPLOWO2_12_FULL_62_13]|nr:MAG: fumarate reductase [Betaproteobacteria bacterium RIFCSPLOWO2_12_FULL_62_13]
MTEIRSGVVVVGCGIAGLAAAVSALQGGASVTILERAPREERGGQTRYTEAYLRMKSETEVTDDFEDQFAQNAGGYLDPSLVHLASEPRENWPAVLKTLGFAGPDVIAAFAEAAGPTIQWLKSFGVRFDFLPTQFLTKSQPRLLPVGGGLALVDALAAEAEKRGAHFVYETAATALIQDGAGKVLGVRAVSKEAAIQEFRANAVVLACGGFEGNPEMLSRYMGPRSIFLRPICRGGYYNKGEGVQMALDIGAAPCGDFGSYHAEPIDPRSGMAEPSVFIFSYGILVNQQGKRFTDEAPTTIDACYERITREIFNQTRGIAYAVLDARHTRIPNYRLGLRTDQPPIEGRTIGELASKLGIAPEALEATVAEYDRACRAAEFIPLTLDGLATQGVVPKKSNWAHPVDQPPFHAYPVISANVLTFGGLKIDRRARVLNQQGDPMPGLYAAGEVVGLYYKNYTGATSVLKGAVFGRFAGSDAAKRR